MVSDYQKMRGMSGTGKLHTGQHMRREHLVVSTFTMTYITQVVVLHTQQALHEIFQFSIERGWVKSRGPSSQNLGSESHRGQVLADHTLRQHYPQDSYRSCIRSGNQINDNSDVKKRSYLRASITFAVDSRKIRSSNLSCSQSIPVNFSKPRMRKHISSAMTEIPVPTRRVTFHKLHYDVGRIFVESYRESDERRTSSNSLV